MIMVDDTPVLTSLDGRPLGRPDHPGSKPPANQSETVQREYEAVKAAAEGKDDAGLEAGTVPGLSSAVLEILAVERETVRLRNEEIKAEEAASKQLDDEQMEAEGEREPTEPTPDELFKAERVRLQTKNLDQLRDEIKKRNAGRPAVEHLSTTGSKHELVDRLMADREVK